jgi:hypothetical protein
MRDRSNPSGWIAILRPQDFAHFAMTVERFMFAVAAAHGLMRRVDCETLA